MKFPKILLRKVFTTDRVCGLFQESPLFQFWPPKARRHLAMSIHRLKKQFDEAIVKQGDPANLMHFLYK